MIKFLKNQDIQITTFAVAKKKVSDNIFYDLILASDGTYDFPLIIPVTECDYNYNSLQTGSFATINYVCDGSTYNTNGFLASSPFTDQNNPSFRLGLKIPSSSVFYPVGDPNYNLLTNPTNLDGTYQGQVYNTIKNSVTVNNIEPAVGSLIPETMQEIKLNSKAYFAAQDRCVTFSDYEARILSLPSLYGGVKKVSKIKAIYHRIFYITFFPYFFVWFSYGFV
jgi:hypothetical protein